MCLTEKPRFFITQSRKAPELCAKENKTKENMIRIILTIAILLFNCLTFSQTAKKENYTLTIIRGKVAKKNKQTFWITPTTLTNNTKDTLRYYSMSCSWQIFYSVDSNKLQVEGKDCDKNIPTILTLAPGKSRTVEIRLLMSSKINSSKIKFKIGFNLMKVSSIQKELDYDFKEQQKKNNIIWSNIISR
ncbi:hypothetical protein SGQ44_15870 [Flavobacterium sp. Fl-77]|uniref:Uncharacterized protein n=1 Tax=Flavobacterium flavipigmentatum TaxID=2893884 RepID=A0AAJ2VXT9_9FLAO|nr:MULTISPECIES: hypothetical protein [unclassified Flavobacterium]MDX6183797.1 hypothetical protein [Flavobacterium sp. Fl-33]MDX6187242.1 hypothetical protein [Flavobacterium sp. Fl-77]UFH38057.1 hypothetical protein LNP22_15115 [Flavobacterium sp. F-70]